MSEQVALCVTCYLRPGTPRSTATSAVVCGPCWAAHGGEPAAEGIGPTPLFTVPSRNPRDQRDYVRCLKAEDWVGGLRADARRNLLTVARVLARYADWDSLNTRPTWNKLIALTRLGRSTVARWLQELRVRGWVAHLERGSTPQFRPMALASWEDGNRAAVYGLRIPVPPELAAQLAADELVAETTAALQAIATETPRSTLGPLHADVEFLLSARAGGEPAKPVDEPVDQAVEVASDDITGTPPLRVYTLNSPSVGGFSRAHASAVDHLLKSVTVPAWKDQTAALRARFDQAKWLDWGVEVPTTRAQMRAAAVWLQRCEPVFARLTIGAIRRELRPFWAAQWTGQDVVHAVRHSPSVFGQPQGVPLYTDRHVASPLMCIRGRLGAWVVDGRVLPGRCSSAAAVQARRGRIGVRLLQAGGGVLTVEQVVQRGRQAVAELQRDAAEVASWRPVKPATPQPPRPKRPAQRSERRRAEQQAALDRGEQLRAEQEQVRARYVEQLHADRASAAPDPTVPDAADQDRDERSPIERHRAAIAMARAQRKANGRPQPPRRRWRR